MLIYINMYRYVEVIKMVKDDTVIEEHTPPKLVGPEEEVRICLKIPKNYIERIDALYVLSRGDSDYEVEKFIRDAVKLSLQGSISNFYVDDAELSLDPRVSGDNGETSQ